MDEVGFTTSQLTDDLFNEILAGINCKASLLSWAGSELITNNTIISNLTASKSSIKRIVGITAFEIKFILQECSEIHEEIVVLKSKPRGKELVSKFCDSMSEFEKDVVDVWREDIIKYGLMNFEFAELYFIKTKDPVTLSIMPEVYWSYIDEENDIFVYVMEYLDPEKFSHLNTTFESNMWESEHIILVLQGIAKVHARYFGKLQDVDEILKRYLTIKDEEYLLNFLPHWKYLIQANKKHLIGKLWEREEIAILERILDNFEYIAEVLGGYPKTLVHLDFSLHNICLRKTSNEVKHRLCVYDWEVVGIGQPQEDIAECLSHLMKPDSIVSDWDFYIEYYLLFLKKELGAYSINVADEHLELEHFKTVFDMSLMQMLVNKFGGGATLLQMKWNVPWIANIVHVGMSYIKKVSFRHSFLQ